MLILKSSLVIKNVIVVGYVMIGCIALSIFVNTFFVGKSGIAKARMHIHNIIKWWKSTKPLTIAKNKIKSLWKVAISEIKLKFKQLKKKVR